MGFDLTESALGGNRLPTCRGPGGGLSRRPQIFFRKLLANNGAFSAPRLTGHGRNSSGMTRGRHTGIARSFNVNHTTTMRIVATVERAVNVASELMRSNV
jgi:hypothetical protein